MFARRCGTSGIKVVSGLTSRPAQSWFGADAPSLRKCLLRDVAHPTESSFGADDPYLQKCLLEDVARPAERSFGGDDPSLRKRVGMTTARGRAGARSVAGWGLKVDRGGVCTRIGFVRFTVDFTRQLQKLLDLRSISPVIYNLNGRFHPSFTRQFCWHVWSELRRCWTLYGAGLPPACDWARAAGLDGCARPGGASG